MPIPKQTFSVLNASGHSISGHGINLLPGLNEGVSVTAFTKAFLGADGQPTTSTTKHLSPSGDKPPSVLPITVKAVPALPQDFALLAIAGAQPEDRRTLQALLEVETRKPVAEAIRAKLAAMDRAAEPPAVEISQPGQRIHFGDETTARDSWPTFAAEPNPSISPPSITVHSGHESLAPGGPTIENSIRSALVPMGSVTAAAESSDHRPSPDEGRDMLIPISHEPESISASSASATMASGRDAPTAPLTSSAEPAIATSTGPARRGRRGQG